MLDSILVSWSHMIYINPSFSQQLYSARKKAINSTSKQINITTTTLQIVTLSSDGCSQIFKRGCGDVHGVSDYTLHTFDHVQRSGECHIPMPQLPSGSWRSATGEMLRRSEEPQQGCEDHRRPPDRVQLPEIVC